MKFVALWEYTWFHAASFSILKLIFVEAQQSSLDWSLYAHIKLKLDQVF